MYTSLLDQKVVDTCMDGKIVYGGSTAWTPEMLVRMSVRRTLS